MSLEMFVQQYLSQLSGGYFARQLAVILCLFIFGGVILDLFEAGELSRIKRVVLAYPAGLCAFSVTAYAMLIIGIPYRTWTVCAFLLAEAIAAIALRRKSYLSHLNKKTMIPMLIAVLIVLVLGAVATSGLVPVSISNDSMYFFRRYPEFIVYYGKLRDQFDFWLTDTGLASVAIDTLPSLFGFGESFGIREFFHIDFILFFALVVYDRAKLRFAGRGAYVASVLVTLVLVMSTPFVVLGHWALANMYFMELFFIVAFLAYEKKDSDIGIVPLLLLALSLLRIEGTLFAVWLIMCISLYTKFSKKLVYYVILPMVLLFGGYCLRIFVGFYVLDNIYLFLTPQKAVMLVAVMIAIGIYLMFVEKRLKDRMPRALPYVYIAVLLAGNLALLALDSNLYIGNLKAFGDNLFRQSGWGIFSHFAVVLAAFIILEYVISIIGGSLKEYRNADNTDISYTLTLTIGFILIVIAAAYGRGDILNEDVGDSGNRVLLQVTPLIVMSFTELMLHRINKGQS